MTSCTVDLDRAHVAPEPVTDGPARGRAAGRPAPGHLDDVVVVLAAVVPLAIFLLRERVIAGAAGFPLDDSWIHLHFARNLVEGAGFSYNPGVPVAGSTAPAWTLLLALGAALFGSSIGLAKATGVFATMAAALVTRRAARAWGAPRHLATAAAVSLLWTGPVAWGALSGMEVSLATLLVAGALLAHAREHAWTTAGLATLAVLARPEAVLLIPFLAASPPLRWRRVARFVAAAVLVLAPAVAFSIATVGAPVPATAAAKVEGGLLGWMTGVSESPLRLLLHRPAEFFRAWAAWLATTHWLLPWALVPAIIAVWRRRRPLGLAALVLAAHPLGMAMLAPYRDPAFQEGRYSTHLLPLAFVALAVAAASLSRSWRRVALATWGILALVSFAPAADRYAWGVQNINAMQVHLGRWVDAHLPESSVLAVNDIGAIAYFSRRPVVDLMGLITPEIIPYRREGEAGVMRYVARRCPDYVIVFPAWFPRMIEQASFEPIYGVRLDRNEVSGAAEMIVYRLTRCTVSAVREEDR